MVSGLAGLEPMGLIKNLQVSVSVMIPLPLRA